MMDFHPRELVLELVYLCDVCVHDVLVDVHYQQGVTVDKQSLDAQRDYEV
jgi:hypothetical protein